MARHPHVTEVHDLHVWEIGSGFPALSAHVLVEPDADCHGLRRELELMLGERFGIDHTTLQVDHAQPTACCRSAARPPRARRTELRRRSRPSSAFGSDASSQYDPSGRTFQPALRKSAGRRPVRAGADHDVEERLQERPGERRPSPAGTRRGGEGRARRAGTPARRGRARRRRTPAAAPTRWKRASAVATSGSWACSSARTCVKLPRPRAERLRRSRARSSAARRKTQPPANEIVARRRPKR